MKWHIEKRNLSQLKQWERNPRIITGKKFEDLKTSINKFGLAEPIVIQPNGMIIGGHARYLALLDKHETECDCYVPERELTSKEVEELNIRLNQNIAGNWDFEALANDFEVKDLLEFGFTEAELVGADFDSSLFNQEGLTDDDSVPEIPKESKVKKGDIFILGNHRLLCGDATKKEDVERLMNEEKTDMIFTDPPYGIDHNTDYSGLAKDKARHSGNAFKKIKGDDKEFNFNIIKDLSKIYLLFGANYYSNQLPVGGWVIWDKSHLSEKYLFTQAEGCWTNKINAVRIFRHKWQGHDRDSERGEKTLHPTQKPIQLIVDILDDIFIEQKTIIDPYLGSGSTLIACEKTKRKCFGLEIEPLYCSVILDRWCAFTGKEAHRLDSGQEQTAWSKIKTM